jgi:uncharacterized oxidoreductase
MQHQLVMHYSPLRSAPIGPVISIYATGVNREVKQPDNHFLNDLGYVSAFIPFPASPVYCATKAAIHSYTQSLRVQLDGTGVTVIELAPPAVETPLLRGEFAEQMKGQKGMDVKVLAARAIAGIESGSLEIRPGLSNVLKAMSRIAPQFMLKQMTKMAMLEQ